MQRFFLPTECVNDGVVVFPENISRQIKQVLRMDEKSPAVVVLDNTGMEYLVQLDANKGKQATGTITCSQMGREEPEIKLVLSFSLTRRDKIEWILQKGTEIGVTEFRPFVSSRSLVQDLHQNSARQARLESIIREAAEQSMRSILPVLNLNQSFEEMVKKAELNTIKLIAWEGTAIIKRISPALLSRENASVPEKFILVVGPEGGFSSDEVRLAEENGFEQVSLGSNILRMETACLVGSALIRHVIETVNNS